MTIETLADEYGSLSTQIKALQQQQDAVKAKLMAYKTDTFIGTQFTVTRSSFEQSRLDTSSIKSEMGDKWILDHSKVSTVTRLTVSISAAALLAA